MEKYYEKVNYSFPAGSFFHLSQVYQQMNGIKFVLAVRGLILRLAGLKKTGLLKDLTLILPGHYVRKLVLNVYWYLRTGTVLSMLCWPANMMRS